jgi:hypothetical protein
MGTFHDDKHELHGITVVVDTDGPDLYVGRCDDMDDEVIILLDGDVHRAEEGSPSKEEYLERAAQMGFWKRFDRLAVPLRGVSSIRRLGEL